MLMLQRSIRCEAHVFTENVSIHFGEDKQNPFYLAANIKSRSQNH